MEIQLGKRNVEKQERSMSVWCMRPCDETNKKAAVCSHRALNILLPGLVFSVSFSRMHDKKGQ